MSVIIKGMKMPKSCKDCPCREYPKFSFESNWCCLNQKTISDVRVISPNCPLIEIPTPRGRLIDADELTKHMRSYYPSIDHLCRSQHVVTKGDIDNAPTIIEAENSSAIDDDVKKYCDYLKSETYDFCNRIENGEVSE